MKLNLDRMFSTTTFDILMQMMISLGQISLSRILTLQRRTRTAFELEILELNVEYSPSTVFTKTVTETSLSLARNNPRTSSPRHFHLLIHP